MRIKCAVLGVCAGLLAMAATQAAIAADRTKVIVLGVDHAAQLVSPADSPAHLAAFLERAAPDAICIERSPEAVARNDYYEFTYEVQDLVVPFARRNGIALCPIDWEPPAEDAKLGFGMDLSAVPEIRPQSGFQQFLAFPQPAQLSRTLFHADEPDNLKRVTQWAATPAAKAEHDLPRRLYLYRTFLQAQRLAAAATARPGETVVLIVGEFHKRDIEAILASHPGIELVQPSAIGLPSAEQVAAADRREYQAAIATFNLLGVQSATGNIDFDFVKGALASLAQSGNTAEGRLLSTRLQVLEKTISPAQALRQYRAIAEEAGDAGFTWNGVQDKSRIDSYFDPFGNLTVRQRALLESARALYALGKHREAGQLRQQLASDLSPRQAIQLSSYWERYVASTPDTHG